MVKTDSNMMLKAYRYRMYPDEEQREMFLKHFGACRFIYNLSLERKIKTYETQNTPPGRRVEPVGDADISRINGSGRNPRSSERGGCQETDKTTLSCYDLNAMLPDLKKEFEWLKEINSQSLQQTNRNLDSAFKRFFREKKGFPKFKSRKNPVQSFGVPQHYTVDFDNNQIKLPKIGWIKTKLSRSFEGILKTATISMTATGKFFISILVEDEKETPKKELFGYDSTMGLDVGIKDFVTMSDGTKVGNPKFLKSSLQRLKVLQRRVSRKKKGSKNRDRARQAVALQHEMITNQRKDFLHKLTTKLVSENQAIAIETLNVTGMMKNHCLAQAIGDVSWSEFFRQLEYKCEWYGKTLLRIGRFEPSSKICSVCGSINHDLKLSDREWTCINCGSLHDRDVNASINIKKFALQSQNLIGVIAPGGTGVEPVGDANNG